ncbi:MAG TPA: amino acid racemase [Pyrinomonadaceae bacterium]|jgi:aspartate racemase|nr:amino acid racemase [Pyrinomonadaceae bacterium]
MRTLGLIGGTGPESTIEYYRLLVAKYREQADGHSPPVIITSVDLKQMIEWMSAGNLAAVADGLAAEFERLQRAGAEIAALTANTPHIVFDELQQRSPLPLISIVEATCEDARARGLNAVGLFGTRYTMQAPFYPAVFSRAGIKLVLPNDQEQEYIHEIYLGELLRDVFRPETRTRLLEIADEMKRRDNIEGLILGGTELPLVLRDEEHNGMPLLDTTRIHVNKLVAEMLR